MPVGKISTIMRWSLILSLLSVVLSGTCGQNVCPVNDPYDSCAGKTVYILDTSSDVTNSTIYMEFDYARSMFIAKTNWNYQIAAFMSFGTGTVYTNPFTNKSALACLHLDTLQQAYSLQGSNSVSLLQVLRSYEVIYYDLDVNNPGDVVLFSASKNVNDIIVAGQYAAQNLSAARFTIVELDGANFTNLFPADNYWTVTDLSNPPPSLGYCSITQTCKKNCNIHSIPPSPTPSPAPGPVSTGPSCECVPTQVWNDVIYLIESSEAAQVAQSDIWGFVQTVSPFFNVQKSGYSASGYYMRVGIIIFSDTVKTIFSLGVPSEEDIDSLYELPYLGGGVQGVNMELLFLFLSLSMLLSRAIQTAVEMFDSAAHRNNSRRVIYMMSTTYNPGSTKAPQKVMKDFQADGGIAIVYNYVPEHGEPASQLQELASPGYFLDSRTASLNDTFKAQCDANCFCRENYEYQTNNIRGYPSNGCYYPVVIQNNFNAAKQNCVKKYHGYIASFQTYDKSAYVRGLISSQYPIWTGLSYNSTYSSWRWADGSALGSYHPFCSDPNTNNNPYYFPAGTNTEWCYSDARNGYYFVCESKPCSSVTYCDDVII